MPDSGMIRECIVYLPVDEVMAHPSYGIEDVEIMKHKYIFYSYSLLAVSVERVKLQI